MSITRPVFKSCFHVENVESVGVFLLSETDYFVLNGRLYGLLAPLLDGRHTADAIADRLSDQASAAEVYYALALLEQRGYITEADESLDPAAAAFWQLAGVDAAAATRRLSEARVSVTALGDLDPAPLGARLQELGLTTGPAGEYPVYLAPDYRFGALADVNRAALAAGRPWLLAKPVGANLWLGPIFQPGVGACWECLMQRLRGNRSVESFLMEHRQLIDPLPTARAQLSTTRDLALDLIATEVAKWVVGGGNDRLRGGLVTFDTRTLETERHVLVKRPQCPVCGDPAEYRPDRPPKPVAWESRRKVFMSDGGHRTSLPEDTFRRYAHHVSPITGAVSSLRRFTRDDDGLIHAYTVDHNFAVNYGRLAFLRRSLRSNSGGKGKSDVQAKLSAFCEAIERYSGVFRGDEIRTTSTYRRLGDAAIHPNACMLFSERQYRERDRLNEGNRLYQFTSQIIPAPFDENAELEWTPLWSLSEQRFKYLPTGYCYFNYAAYHGIVDARNLHYLADSNGHAAGNTLEEATLQGFLELAERDAVGMWWYNRVSRPPVDLDSAGDPYLDALREYLRGINRDLWVMDLTNDLGIPVFVAVSRRTEGTGPEEIVIGFGAHLDPQVALSRAVTEVNQFLAVFIERGEGEGRYQPFDQAAAQWWQTATIENQPYLVPLPNAAARRLGDYPKLWTEDLRDDIETCVRITGEHGLETLVLDQTRPDIGLSVAKVVVPGLRHMWARLAAGRLYDVPVREGWLKEPRAETDLNPMAVFF